MVKKEEGSIGEMMTSGICLLAMTVIMLAYLNNASLLRQKAEVSQIARKYILRMETVGMLTDADRITMGNELEAAGVTHLRLDGTTLWQVDYGDPIALRIQGKLGNQYEFTEKRVSTAKH